MKSVKEQLRGKMWDKISDQLLDQVSFTLWNELSEQITHGLPYELYWTIIAHFNEELKNERINLD